MHLVLPSPFRKRLPFWMTKGRWVTIPADGPEGQGNPVYIEDDGTISKGPPNLVGKKPNELGKKPKPAKPPGMVGDSESPQPGQISERRVEEAERKKEEEQKKEQEKPVTFKSRKDFEKAKEYARKTHGEWGRKLTPEQKKAFKDYGGEDVYKKINPALRGGTVPSQYAKTVQYLDDAINSAPPTTQSLVLYRGVGVGVAKRMEIGGEFVDNGYTSTSINFIAAEGFAEDVMIEVRVPKGKKLAAMDVTEAGTIGGEEGENEWILPRGSRFRVLQKKRDVIVVELV